jgi:hypothetical protein
MQHVKGFCKPLYIFIIILLCDKNKLQSIISMCLVADNQVLTNDAHCYAFLINISI